MNQILKIIRWEFINRVKTKLFLITTFVLPLFIGGVLYLPALLMDIEPENEAHIGLVYSKKILPLIDRFKERFSEELEDGVISEEEFKDNIKSHHRKGHHKLKGNR